MIVYVESNFVIEHALRQEDFEACEALVHLCLSKVLEIAIPAYCLMEPYETFVRRRSERKKLKDQIDIEAKQLGRTPSYRADAQQLTAITAKVLVDGAQQDFSALEHIRRLLLNHAVIIPLTSEVLSSAAQLQDQHGLQMPDATVLASVKHHAATRLADEKVFVNKNSKDFADPDIVEELLALNCRSIFKFAHGLGYVKSTGGI